MTGWLCSEDPFYGTTSFTVLCWESESMNTQRISEAKTAIHAKHKLEVTSLSISALKEANDPPLPPFSNETQTL